MRFLSFIMCCIAVIGAVAAATKDSRSLPTEWLEEADATRWLYCVNCILSCRHPNLAKKQAIIQIRFMYQHAPATCPDICSKRVRGYVVRDFDTVFRIQNVGGLDEDAFWYLLHYGAAQQAYADHARTLNCTEEDYDRGYNTARDKTLPQNWPSGQPPPRLPSPSREFFDRRRLPLPPDEFFDERRRSSSQGKDSPPPPDQSSSSPAKVQQIDDRQQHISHPTPNEKNYKPPWSRILRGIKIPSPNIARVLRAVNNVNTGRRRPVASFPRPPPLLPFP